MPSSLKVGIVGYGQVAAFHARLLREAGHDPLWIVGPVAGKAAAFARAYGFRRHGVEMAEMVGDPALDAVWICSPNQVHAAQARRCLEAGKHVLVEVPLAMDATEGAELVALADARGLVAAVGHNHRYLGGPTRVHDLIAAGDLDVISVYARYLLMRRTNVGTNGYARSWTDSLLWHHGMHSVDLITWLLGVTLDDLPQVTATGTTLGGTGTAPMDVTLALTTSQGRAASLQLSYNSFQNINDLVITGVENTFGVFDGILRDRTGVVLDFSDDMLRGSDDARRRLNREFVGAITDGAALLATAASVLPALHVTQSAEEQLSVRPA
ncbi:Gfo/Idh/MocA family oxidoreductase [Micromonospora sp. NPDC049645]|uniref:Gfo/Idh/MocA family oxidoreductase n=1 Tax=Micromonospora sp. NPDC049645 TaxID=3155508 RepID=UPI0034205499